MRRRMYLVKERPESTGTSTVYWSTLTTQETRSTQFGVFCYQYSFPNQVTLLFVRCRISNWVRVQIGVSTLISLPKWAQLHNLSADEKFCSIFMSNWSSSPNFGPKLVLLLQTMRISSSHLPLLCHHHHQVMFQVLIENNELKPLVLDYIQ
jgi:hypothetical protein